MIYIAGSGVGKAAQKVTNDELSTIMDTSHDWIYSRTGIASRFISDNQSTVDLACLAAHNALTMSSIAKEEIDLIVVATMTPDYFTPSCACLVQERLGLNNQQVMAFDINAACSGFLYSLQVVMAMLESKQYRNALVIGAEVMSKVLNWEDRGTSILFGDGAGALLLSTTTGIPIKRYAHYHGSRGNAAVLQAPALAARPKFTNAKPEQHCLSMDGPEVFRFAVEAMMHCMDRILADTKQEISDIDLVIPHQANVCIIQSVMRKYHIREDQIFLNLQEYGNTSAASVAIAFATLQANQRIHPGMKIILVGFGAGLTWGTTYLEL